MLAPTAGSSVQRLFHIVLLFAAFGLAGCDPTVAPTPTREATTSLAVICEAEQVGQVRTVEGFFIYPDELTAEPELMLILNSAPGGVEPYVHVSVPVGTGPNQVEPPPAEASDQDLRVHTASGEVADMTGRVRVTGTVTAGDMGDGTTCFLDEPTISLPADVNPVP